MRGTGGRCKTFQDLTGGCRQSVSEHVAWSLDTAGLVRKVGSGVCRNVLDWGLLQVIPPGPFAGSRLLLQKSRTLPFFLPGCKLCGEGGLREPGPTAGYHPRQCSIWELELLLALCQATILASNSYTWMPLSIPGA